MHTKLFIKYYSTSNKSNDGGKTNDGLFGKIFKQVWVDKKSDD